jgi:hypothetical protein
LFEQTLEAARILTFLTMPPEAPPRDKENMPSQQRTAKPATRSADRVPGLAATALDPKAFQEKLAKISTKRASGVGAKRVNSDESANGLDDAIPGAEEKPVDVEESEEEDSDEEVTLGDMVKTKKQKGLVESLNMSKNDERTFADLCSKNPGVADMFLRAQEQPEKDSLTGAAGNKKGAHVRTVHDEQNEEWDGDEDCLMRTQPRRSLGVCVYHWNQIDKKKAPCFEYLMTWRSVVNLAAVCYIVSETFESTIEAASRSLYMALNFAFPELFPSVHDAAEAIVSFVGWCKFGVIGAKRVNCHSSLCCLLAVQQSYPHRPQSMPRQVPSPLQGDCCGLPKFDLLARLLRCGVLQQRQR